MPKHIPESLEAKDVRLVGDETVIIRKGARVTLDQIVELQEVNQRLANRYIAHGYVLLGLAQVARWFEKTDKHGKELAFPVRYLRYVVGRSGDVDAYDPEAEAEAVREAAAFEAAS